MILNIFSDTKSTTNPYFELLLTLQDLYHAVMFSISTNHFSVTFLLQAKVFNFAKSSTPSLVLFIFFRLYKRYQIA